MRDRVASMVLLLAGILASMVILSFVVYLANTSTKMDTETAVRREYQEDLNTVASNMQYLDSNRVLTTSEVIEFIRDNGIKYNYFIVVDDSNAASSEENVIDITPYSKNFKDAYAKSVSNSGTTKDVSDMATYLQNVIYTSNYLRNELLHDYLDLHFKPFIYVNRSGQDADSYKDSLAVTDSLVTQQSKEFEGKIKGNVLWTSNAVKTTPFLSARNYTMLDAINEKAPFVIVFKQWESDKYSIYWFDLANPNFHYDGDVSELPDSYKRTSPTIYPPNASKVSRLGYDFKGWSPTSIPSGSSGDIEFKGKWEAHKYNVHFNTNGGNLATGTDVVADYSDGYDSNGYRLPSGDAVNKDGYIFAGWYLDSGLTEYAGDNLVGGYYDEYNVWHGGNVVPNPDGSISGMTLYAKWEPAPSLYKVTYKSSGNGKVIGSSSSIGAHYGDTITLTNPSGGIPDLPGYKPSVTSKPVTINSTGNTVQNIEIIYNPISYKITYDMGIAGGTAQGGPTSYTIEDTLNLTNTYPKPTGYNSAGYKFLGWSPSEITNSTGDIVVKALWEPITKPYTVYCKSSKSNEIIATFEYRKDFSTLGGATSFNVKAPTSDGDANFKFSGVTNPKSGTLLGYELDDSAQKSVTTTDTSVTFKYKPIVYTLEYVADDNNTIKFFEGDSSVKHTYTAEDADFTVNYNPNRVGYKFSKWNSAKVTKEAIKDATSDNKILVKAEFEFIKYPIDYLNTAGATPTVKGGTKWDYYTVNPADNYYENFKVDDLPNGFNQDGYYYAFDHWVMRWNIGEDDIVDGKVTVGAIPDNMAGDAKSKNGLLDAGVDIVANKYYPDYPATTNAKEISYVVKKADYVKEERNGKIYYSLVNKSVATAQGKTVYTDNVRVYGYVDGSINVNKLKSKPTNQIIYDDIGKGLGNSNPPVMTFYAYWKKMYWMWDYDYTGNVQTFTAPETGVYMLECWGANGGGGIENPGVNSHGGIGGYSRGLRKLNKGDKIYIYVGGRGTLASALGSAGGYNGGGQGGPSGYGGGGMTHISTTQNVATSKMTGGQGTKEYGLANNGMYQIFTAPTTTTYTIEAWGGQGGGGQQNGPSRAGLGGYTKGTITLNQNQKVYIFVGGQGSYASAINTGGGWNGGGHGGPGGYGGGGQTDVILSQNVHHVTGSSGYGSGTVSGNAMTFSGGTFWWGPRSTGIAGHIYRVDYYGSNLTTGTFDTYCYTDSTTIHNNCTELYRQGNASHMTIYWKCNSSSKTAGQEFRILDSTATITDQIVVDMTANAQLMIAGGGGGSDNCGQSEIDNYSATIGGNDDGFGGAGGGATAGAGGKNGVAATTPASQSGPNSTYRGFGQKATISTDTGGGGAGYYGGLTTDNNNGGAGGGSGYIGSGLTNTANTAGVNSGNGKVKITYNNAVASGSWSENGTIIIAGGGGGADNAASMQNVTLTTAVSHTAVGTGSLATMSGDTITIPASTHQAMTFPGLLQKNKTYTIIYDAKSTVAGDKLYVDAFPDSLPEQSQTLTTAYKTYTWTFTIPDSAVTPESFRVFSSATATSGTMTIKNIIVRGASIGTADDGSGGYGGGTSGGNALIDGADSVATNGTGAGGTQSSGFAKGYGESVTKTTDTGGAGAGYYGGRATNHNNGGSGGGSGHYYGNLSYELVSGLQAYNNQNSNPLKSYQYNGRSQAGYYATANDNNGNGRARITWKGDGAGKATSSVGAWNKGILLAYDEMLTEANLGHDGAYFSIDRRGTYLNSGVSPAQNVSIGTTGSKRLILQTNHYDTQNKILNTITQWTGATYR